MLLCECACLYLCVRGEYSALPVFTVFEDTPPPLPTKRTHVHANTNTLRWSSGVPCLPQWDRNKSHMANDFQLAATEPDSRATTVLTDWLIIWQATHWRPKENPEECCLMLSAALIQRRKIFLHSFQQRVNFGINLIFPSCRKACSCRSGEFQSYYTYSRFRNVRSWNVIWLFSRFIIYPVVFPFNYSSSLLENKKPIK